jgi:hypothetical protein
LSGNKIGSKIGGVSGGKSGRTKPGGVPLE